MSTTGAATGMTRQSANERLQDRACFHDLGPGTTCERSCQPGQRWSRDSDLCRVGRAVSSTAGYVLTKGWSSVESQSGDVVITAQFTVDQLQQPDVIHTTSVPISVPCSDCRDSTAMTAMCVACRGRGYVAAHRSARFRLPTPAHYGQLIRVPGRGALRGDGSSGDLYIRIQPPSPQPPPPSKPLAPIHVGSRINAKKLSRWGDEMAPFLFPDERVDYVVRTTGISPAHDHCIVTSVRVWIAQSPPTSSPPVLHIARSDVVDATPIKASRIILHTSTGTRHNIPLFDANDRPRLIALLGRAKPEPTMPDGFVAYSTSASSPGVEFDASQVPEPGDPVPEDCVWSRVPYPGPLPRRSWNSVISVMRLDPVARPIAQITYMIGEPSARSENPDGSVVLQWQRIHPAKGNSFHLALLFDRYGVCESVVHKWIDP